MCFFRFWPSGRLPKLQKKTLLYSKRFGVDWESGNLRKFISILFYPCISYGFTLRFCDVFLNVQKNLTFSVNLISTYVDHRAAEVLRVDLPQPLLPTTAVVLPARRSKVILDKTCTVELQYSWPTCWPTCCNGSYRLYRWHSSTSFDRTPVTKSGGKTLWSRISVNCPSERIHPLPSKVCHVLEMVCVQETIESLYGAGTQDHKSCKRKKNLHTEVYNTS